ncbi:hypothetical protein ITJ43_09540 [Microbacterium sp. VKM Ac-2870]|uniref:hypothetical protein n=1 Tax=Microbacterium sp. VKM Ac-2870 TaxID=2783825 RepID=UPI00188D0CF8|nr:hypothetical protein [Microbacterium sp. VKM Ac-2870]MBF4562384.1 hypothetical protein [Microbacterium sp. VKM Ac-2870]
MENPTDTTDTHHIPDAHSFARWVRAVDRLLWQERAAALTADDISPRDARLLHVLASDHASTLLAHLSHRGKRLRRLAERGWVAEADGTWSLTDAGRAAADRLAQRANELGSRPSEAVSTDELAAASRTLEAVARALGWREGESREGRHPHHPGGFGPRGHRFGHGRHGFGPGAHGFGPRERVHGGRDRHGDDVADRDSRHGDAESAYERGFAAGFSEGRTAASA